MDYKTDEYGREQAAAVEKLRRGFSAFAEASTLGSKAAYPDETPELELLFTRLFSTAEELARAEARLSGFADRLGGPTPECDQKSCHPSGSSGFASRMDDLHSSLTTMLIDINSTISRLERLA